MKLYLSMNVYIKIISIFYLSIFLYNCNESISGNEAISEKTQDTIEHLILTHENQNDYTHIKYITGSLIITNSVNSLTGLNLLITVGRDFTLSNNNLTSLTGLENLTNIHGSLSITDNSLLFNFCALQNTTITGNYLVFRNAYNPSQIQVANSDSCNIIPMADTTMVDNLDLQVTFTKDSIYFFEDLEFRIQGEFNLNTNGFLYIQSSDRRTSGFIGRGIPTIVKLQIDTQYITTTFNGVHTNIMISYKNFVYLGTPQGDGHKDFRCTQYLPQFQDCRVWELMFKEKTLMNIWGSNFQHINSSDTVFIQNKKIAQFYVKAARTRQLDTLTPTFNSAKIDSLLLLMMSNFQHQKLIIGNSWIGVDSLQSISMIDGSSVIVGLLDQAIDLNSPVYPFLSFDYIPVDQRQTQWYGLDENNRYLRHGERMVLYMLKIAPKLKIFNINSLGFGNNHPLDYDSTLLSINNFDIISSSGSSISSFSDDAIKNYLDDGGIIAVSLGNNGGEPRKRKMPGGREHLFYPYQKRILSGAYIVIQAAIDVAFSSRSIRSLADDCQYYTLTLPETGNGATSQATASFSASLSLLIDANREKTLGYTNRQLVEILFQTADDIGARGVDSIFGHGLINLPRAYRFILTKVTPTFVLYSDLSLEEED